jgi:hypothetical protein
MIVSQITRNGEWIERTDIRESYGNLNVTEFAVS